MGSQPDQRIALMAIHPHYAEAILDGLKLVEFRKRRLASDIRVVLIYATSPVQRVVGTFDVGEIVEATPQRIWQEYGDSGVISRDKFFEYYKDSQRAVAITVDSSRRFSAAMELADLDSQPAIPQSFSYVSAAELVACDAGAVQRFVSV